MIYIFIGSTGNQPSPTIHPLCKLTSGDPACARRAGSVDHQQFQGLDNQQETKAAIIENHAELARRAPQYVQLMRLHYISAPASLAVVWVCGPSPDCRRAHNLRNPNLAVRVPRTPLKQIYKNHSFHHGVIHFNHRRSPKSCHRPMRCTSTTPNHR
uniref:Uncharacterized protein n=1 Tax=Powellomyces hirtus TaxID=109895 RepID=A0A4P8NQL5_9FUNG|nr:hypothetical protein [Powellomyces hirtus]